MARNDEKKEVCCSFCGKKESEVVRLISGNDVFICNECIQICNGILNDGFVDEDYEGEIGDLPKPKEIKEVLDQYF